MATRADIRTDLVLEIDGPHVTPEKFLGGVRSFFVILSEVTAKIGRKKDAVVWLVQVKEGSNLVQVLPQPGSDRALVAQITNAMSEGIVEVEDEARVPAHFSERALRSLSELGKLASDDGEHLSIKVWALKKPIPITTTVVAHVSEVLAAEHEDHGSIEGRLETVTDRKGLHFVIVEPVTGQSIRCYIQSEELLEQAFANFRKRVEVYGVIKYRKDGKPISIRVEDLVPFPPDESLPSYREVHGILRGAS